MAIQSHTLEFLTQWLVTQGFTKNVSVTLLLGDGSTRSFYRVQDLGNSASWILVSDPTWKQTKDYPAHQRALEEAKISVPVFRASDPKMGLLLMQDFGDELLQNRIQKEPEKKEAWLQKAVVLLAHLHGRLYPVSEELPASQRRFDEQKLFEELCFTIEHLREKLLNMAPLSSNNFSAIRSFCQTLDGFGPLVFCHRDYHCRNLLVYQNELWMIDFQDARLGPPGYDLASLVFDAYVPISKETRQHLIALYLKTLEAYSLRNEIREASFEKELLLLAYQRTLKAAGSFASFWTRFKKSTHLTYIEPALLLASSIEKMGLIPDGVTKSFEIDTLIKQLHEQKKNQ